MKIIHLIIFALLSSSCSGVRCGGSDVNSVALCHAAHDFPAEEKVALKSVREFKNGGTGVIDSNRQDEYALQLREKLTGSEYYEVCFSPSPPRLGGGGCYFIEKVSMKLLAKHLSV